MASRYLVSIVEAWRVARSSPVVIVRSSAIGEDSADASFAGQLESIARRQTVDDLRQRAPECLASRGSDRVRAYERARGHALGGLGIIIQQQIDAAMSGVLFTSDPAAPARSADRVLRGRRRGARRRTRSIPGRDRSSTTTVRRAHAVAADGVVTNVRSRPRTTLAAEARRIARGVRRAAGHRVDDRRRRAGSGSCRRGRLPSFRTQGGQPDERSKILWSNANVNENFPEPITPLLYSVASAGYYHYFLNLGRAFGLSRRRLAAIDDPLRQIIGVHGARMYYNLTSIHTVLRAAPFGEQLAAAFNQFVGAEDGAPGDRPSGLARMARGPGARAGAHRRRGRRGSTCS